MTDRPRTLVWASSLVVLMTSVEVVYVLRRSEYTPGLRVGLAGVLALQLLFALGVMRLSAGSVLALMAYEVMAVVAAIGGDGALVIRGALAARRHCDGLADGVHLGVPVARPAEDHMNDTLRRVLTTLVIIACAVGLVVAAQHTQRGDKEDPRRSAARRRRRSSSCRRRRRRATCSRRRNS